MYLTGTVSPFIRLARTRVMQWARSQIHFDGTTSLVVLRSTAAKDGKCPFMSYLDPLTPLGEHSSMQRLFIILFTYSGRNDLFEFDPGRPLKICLKPQTHSKFFPHPCWH